MTDLWNDPDFVRDEIENNPKPLTETGKEIIRKLDVLEDEIDAAMSRIAIQWFFIGFTLGVLTMWALRA